MAYLEAWTGDRGVSSFVVWSSRSGLDQITEVDLAPVASRNSAGGIATDLMESRCPTPESMCSGSLHPMESVVTKNVEPFTVVAGNPARVIKRLQVENNHEGELR